MGIFMRILNVMIVFLTAIFVLTACSEDKKRNEASDIVSAPDFGRLIENFEELVASSDLVVIGTVDKVHPASIRNLNLDKSATALPYNTVYTDLDIKVEKIILGNMNQGTQNMFTMKQAGGLYEGKEYIYEPIVEEGKTYLFFLSTFDKWGAPEEPYTLVGSTEEVIIPVEGEIVKFHPSLSLTDPLAAKQIIDAKFVDHNVILKVNDVIAEVIRVDNYLPEPVEDILDPLL